jgi:hypothetical protein
MKALRTPSTSVWVDHDRRGRLDLVLNSVSVWSSPQDTNKPPSKIWWGLVILIRVPLESRQN